MPTNDETKMYHRFVQIKHFRELARDEKIAVWDSLNHTTVAAIAVSNACQALVETAQTDWLTFKDTLDRFQNLVLVCDSPVKLSIFLHAITQLLIYHVNNDAFHAERFNLTADQSGTVHPFVSILCKRPDIYRELHAELDFLLDCSATRLFETMEPYFDAVFFMNVRVDPTLLLNRLAVDIYVSGKQEMQTKVLEYLLMISQRLPTQRAQHHYLAVMDVLIDVITTRADNIGSGLNIQHIATGIVYQLLCQAYDNITYNRPVLPYLQRIQRLFSHDGLASPELHVVWIALSYLLLTVQTMIDQAIVLHLMKTVMHHVSGDTLLVAYVPLLQAQMELPKHSKSDLPQLLSFVNQADTTPLKDAQDVIKNIENDVRTHSITGGLAHMIPGLCQFLQRLEYTELEGSLAKTEMSRIHTLLLTVPQVFNKDIDIRHAALSRVANISLMMLGASCSLPILYLLLHVMAHPRSTPDTLIYILRKVMPSLVQVNDSITTSAILRIALSIIYGNAGGVQSVQETTMASLGIKFLYENHKRHSRIWQELKKALSGWILRRKSRTTRSSITQGQAQMELSVLTTMRDLCIYRPNECAQDVLPMVISLLQTCLDLNMASTSLIVETICACVQAGLADPRSVWTLAMRYVAQYADTIEQDRASTLWESICSFFTLVGQNDEVTEHYIKFKEDVLTGYLVRLVASQNERTQSAALRALSEFPAMDIMTLLPEKAKDYLNIIASSDHINKDYAAVLVKLMSHELDHMRRGLFKEDSQAKSSSEEEHAKKHQPRLQIGEKEEYIGNLFMAAWENNKIAPGLRKGYHIAILHASKNYFARDGPKDTIEELTKSKWYRCMKSGIDGVGLTDHLLLRISSIGAWTSFFTTVMAGDQGHVDTKSRHLLQDLLGRLNTSTLPGTTCNILLALTGMIVALFRALPASAASCASELIKRLTLGSSYKDEASLRSDEAKFAARMCVGHIAECIITNEKEVADVLGTLLSHATDEHGPVKDIGIDVDLVQFANGYAAGHFTAVLSAWPTMTNTLKELAQKGVAQLLAICKAPNISESRILGILMGWASRLQIPEMEDVYNFGRETMRRHIDSPECNKGRLFGSAWICGYGADGYDGIPDQQAMGWLESARDQSEPEHAYHFSVPLARLERLALASVEGVEDEASTEYSAKFLREMQPIQQGGTSSVNVIAAVFALGSLLGANYLNDQQEAENVRTEARKYSKDVRNHVLGVLVFAAGLDVNESFDNLKVNRVSAMVCGNVVQSAMTMRQVQQMELSDAGGNQASGMFLLGSVASNEPKSYSRLNNNTSYLRAVFDACVRLTEEHEQFANANVAEESALLYLKSLTDTPGPLPTVNWFNLLLQLARLSKITRQHCFMFASTHAATSQSLTEYVIAELGQGVARMDDPELMELLVGEVGLGKVLELGGLSYNQHTSKHKRRGMDAVTNKTHVSEMRATEIVGAYAEKFVTLPLPVQLAFLETLHHHLPTEYGPTDTSSANSLVQSLRELIMYQITFRLLNRSVPCEMTARVIRQTVECSIGDVEQLLQGMTLKEWLTQETMEAKVIALTTVCRLRRTQRTTWWITEMVTRGLELETNDAHLWGIVAQTIEHDAQDLSAWIDWICRLLDVLIVISSNVHLVDTVKCAALHRGMTLLRRVLAELFCYAFYSVDSPSIAARDTAHWLAYIIDLGNDEQQLKMMKRIFSLADLVQPLDDEVNGTPIYTILFNVLRTCRQKTVDDSKWTGMVGHTLLEYVL